MPVVSEIALKSSLCRLIISFRCAKVWQPFFSDSGICGGLAGVVKSGLGNDWPMVDDEKLGMLEKLLTLKNMKEVAHNC